MMCLRPASSARKTPKEAFKVCPYCESQNIRPMDEEVFCLDCNWDSIAINAELTPGDPYYPMPVTRPAAVSNVTRATSTQAPRRHPAATKPAMKEGQLACAN